VVVGPLCFPFRLHLPNTRLRFPQSRCRIRTRCSTLFRSKLLRAMGFTPGTRRALGLFQQPVRPINRVEWTMGHTRDRELEVKAYVHSLLAMVVMGLMWQQVPS
jgi:hypothetical protein